MSRTGQAAALNAPMPKISEEVVEEEEKELTFATISYALQDVFDVQALVATANKLAERRLFAMAKPPEKYSKAKLRSLLLRRVQELYEAHPELLSTVKSSIDAVARTRLHKR